MKCRHCGLPIQRRYDSWEHYDKSRDNDSWRGCSYARRHIGGEKIIGKGGGPYAEPPTKELNISKLLRKVDEISPKLLKKVDEL